MSGPQLTGTVTVLVLVAGVLHAVWNAIASEIEDKVVAFGLIGVAYTVVAALALPFTGMPAAAAVRYAVLSSVIQVGYNVALLNSYRLGDFGKTYSVARGTSPLLVAAGAWVFAGEHLTALQSAGIATVAAGIGVTVFAGGRLTRADLPATGAALLTGVAIAAYTVVDGIGVRQAHNPFGYAAFLFVLQGPVVAIIAGLSRRHQRSDWVLPKNLVAGLSAGVLSLAAYGIVVWAQARGPLAVVSALRETSVISAALIATLVFHEPAGRRRIPSAVAVAAGIILINL